MRTILSLSALLLITGCVSAPPPPPPPVRRVSPPPVAALPAPEPLASDWRDWPQTPGDWGYHRHTGSSATFGSNGEGRFVITCTNDKRVELTVPGASPGSLTIRTSTLTRRLATTPRGDPPSALLVALSPTDPLLDAIAFSRGRFVVEQPGQPPLVLPAWAEIERVIEDCRA